MIANTHSSPTRRSSDLFSRGETCDAMWSDRCRTSRVDAKETGIQEPERKEADTPSVPPARSWYRLPFPKPAAAKRARGIRDISFARRVYFARCKYPLNSLHLSC